jgi:uncharacterized membrane protein YedE/YeeE
MWIDAQHFTPVPALTGGALIGGAAGLLVLVNGRIAGITGILSGVLFPQRGEFVWRVAFLAGLLLAGALLPELGLPLIPDAMPVRSGSHLHTATLMVAGVLVGIGTR